MLELHALKKSNVHFLIRLSMAKEIQTKHAEAEKGVKSKGVNGALWVASAVLFAVAAIGNAYFATHFAFIVRILLLIVLLVGAVALAALTNQGQKAIGFMKDSRQELRKIIWPTRAETTQTTLIVGAMCLLVALALWGIDSIIVAVINFLTNLRF